MQVERKTSESEAILEVFRDLGLEDAKVRDNFKKLAKPSDWRKWEKRGTEPQDTRNNTANEQGNDHA